MVGVLEGVCSQTLGLENGNFLLDAANKSTGFLTLAGGYRSITIARGDDGEVVQMIDTDPADLIDYVGRAAIGILSILFVVPFLFGVTYKYMHFTENQELYNQTLGNGISSYHLSIKNLFNLPSDVLGDEETKRVIESVPTTQVILDEMDRLIPDEWDGDIMAAADGPFGDFSRDSLRNRLQQIVLLAEAPEAIRDNPIPFIPRAGCRMFRDDMRQYMKLIIAFLENPSFDQGAKVSMVASLWRAIGVCQPTWIRATRAIVDQHYNGADATSKWKRAVQQLKNHTIDSFGQREVRRHFPRLAEAVHHHLTSEILHKVQSDVMPDMSAARFDDFNSLVPSVSRWFTRGKCLDLFFRDYTPDEIADTLEVKAFESFNEESEEEAEIINTMTRKAVLAGDTELYWVPPDAWAIPGRGADADFDESYDRETGTFRDSGYIGSGLNPAILFRERGVVIRGVKRGAPPPEGAVPIKLIPPQRENFASDALFRAEKNIYDADLDFCVKNCVSSSFQFSVGTSSIPNTPVEERYTKGGRNTIRGIGKYLGVHIGVLSAPENR